MTRPQRRREVSYEQARYTLNGRCLFHGSGRRRILGGYGAVQKRPAKRMRVSTFCKARSTTSPANACKPPAAMARCS